LELNAKPFVTNMQKAKAAAVMEEFINMFDEFVFCMTFASRGVAIMGNQMANNNVAKDHQTWIGSNLPHNPRMHARINTIACIKKCEENGEFSNTIAKSLLCTMYSLWDEDYRHRIANASDCDARYIECQLMGDLRKIRHCVIHQKSIVPAGGLKFEVLDWEFPEGELKITHDMFLEFNDAVRGNKMNIRSLSPPSAIEELTSKMTKKERKSFDDFFKNRENKLNGKEWPDLDKFLNRIGYTKND
jgi:hypothetical protein